MHPIYNIQATISATSLLLLLLCLCLSKEVNAGGKGKAVPIYMPVPIPIPMPMGPSGGGGKHHHHQQHQDDDEGEVKKIYLLQPMPKVHPQPQLKGGGFMGPVQTHIHMPAPVVTKLQPNRGHNKHEGDIGQTSSHSGGKYGHHHHDIKILPIVVIPPIAPMPAIQTNSGPTQNHHQAPRMNLQPQFNNYLVSAGNGELDDRRPMLHQDHKSFSDYGGSGGALVHRDSFAPRVRSLSGRLHGRQASHDYLQAGSNKIRSHDGGYDDYGEPTWRSSGSHGRTSDGGSGRWSRRRSYHYEQPTGGRWSSSGRGSSGGINSIRDIVSQQSHLFDDEPYNLVENSDPIRYPSRRNRHYPTDEHSSASSLDHDAAPAPLTSTAPGSADSDYPPRFSDGQNSYNLKSSPDYRQDGQHQSSMMDGDNSREMSHNGAADGRASRDSHRQSDLSSLYYHRDLHQIDQQQQQPSKPFVNRPTNYKNLRSQIEEAREIFEDDEWRFDSIKSVAHTNPNVIAIVEDNNSNSTKNTNLPRKTSTKYLLKPENGKKILS